MENRFSLSRHGAASLKAIAAAIVAVDLPQDGKQDTASLEVFGAVVGIVMCGIFASQGLALGGFVRNGQVVPSSLWWALIGGPLVGAGAAIFRRCGMLMTSDLKVQVIVIHHAVCLSLVWLYSALGPVVGDVHAGLLLGWAGCNDDSWRQRRDPTLQAGNRG